MISTNLTEGKLLHLRLFLEGIEVPVISANIVETINQPAQADVQIPATAAALALKPRTSVLLFYYEPRVQTYCLGFVGELVGVSYSKTDASRAINLQCMDHTTYWDLAFSYYLQTGAGASFDNLIKNKALFLQASNSFDSTTDKLKLITLLKEAPLTSGLRDIRGIPGGLIRIFEFMLTGLEPSGNIEQINSFLVYSNIRNRLLQQISGLPHDPTAVNLFNTEALNEFLRNSVLSSDSVINYAQLVQYINQFTHYQHFPVMRPLFESSAVEARAKGDTSVSKYLQDRLLTDIAYIEDYVQEGRAVAAVEKAVSFKDSLALITAEDFGDLEVAERIRAGAYVETMTALVDQVLKQLEVLDVPQQELQNLQAVTPLVQRMRKDTEGLFDITGIKEFTRGDRLHSRIFAPNLFFAPAPRCNVIFPEYYNSLRFNRSLVNEPSRLALKGHELSEKQNISLTDGLSIVYAPSLTRAESPAIVYPELFKLLDHEKHTGIVPAESTLGNRFEIDVARTQTGNNAMALREQLQNIADYEFFLRRFGSRTAEVSGKFNPDMVVGLPCVILDNPNVPPETKTVDDIKNNGLVLQQFVGAIHSITHYISQADGASTSATINYIRSHRGEDDDIIKGVLRKGEIARQKEKSLAAIAAVAQTSPVAAATVKTLELPQPEDVVGGEGPLSQEQVDTLQQAQLLALETVAAIEIVLNDADKAVAESMKTRSMEAYLRPVWLSDNYSNENIGTAFYKFSLGVKAITDVVSVADKEAFANQTDPDLTIENAVDYLTLRYALQRSHNSTTRFAETYTFRPVATLDQIMHPTKGFFGPVFDPSKGLVPVEGSLPLNLDAGECAHKLAEAAQSVDSRAEKIKAVGEYLKSIRSRGLQN